MQWSISIGRIAGTDIRIHLTFLILLLWVGIADYMSGGAEVAWSSVLFLVLVFGCVLLHEFGHILAAKRFGIATPYVTLLPIGGVASMERMPERPIQELVIAIAGPLVNVAIAAMLMLGSGFSPGQLQSLEFANATLLERLVYVNAGLVIFNMVPAFPMDGGRVFRALLAMRLGPRRATDVAALVGQGFAFLFVLAGLFLNPMLILVGLFVFMAATSEQQASAFRWFATGLTVESAMETHVRSLSDDKTLSQAIDALLDSAQREFPIVDGNGRPVGILSREQIVQGLQDKGNDVAVGLLMGKVTPIRKDAPLEEAVMALHREGRKASAIVDENGKLAGLLTLDNISEMLLIHAASPEWRFGRG